MGRFVRMSSVFEACVHHRPVLINQISFNVQHVSREMKQWLCGGPTPACVTVIDSSLHSARTWNQRPDTDAMRRAEGRHIRYQLILRCIPGTEPTVSGLVHFVLYCKVRGSDLLSGRCPVNCRSELEQNGTKTCMGVKVIIFWFMDQLWFGLKGINSTLYDMDWFQLEWSQHVFTLNKSMDLLKLLWWFHCDFTIWLSFLLQIFHTIRCHWIIHSGSLNLGF